MLLNQGGVFLHYGQIELAIISVFGLTSLALRWQLANLNLFHQHIHIAEVYEYLIKLAFVSLLFTYYIRPIPGTSISLDHIFNETAKVLSSVLNVSIIDDMRQRLQQAKDGLPQPNPLNVFASIGYYLDIALLAALEVGGILLNAFGLAMTGLCALFGPLFMPLLLTKNFSKWFWRWVDNFFAYSMYRVVAIAITYLYYAVIVAFFDAYVGKNYSLGHFEALLFYLMLLAWAYLYAIFKIPSITHALFGGAGVTASELTAGAVDFLARALM